MKISLTKPIEISSVNQIIVQAKSFWNYEQSYLEAAIPHIQINQDWLNLNEGYSIYTDHLVGFMGLEFTDSKLTLEHLWIHPSCMKQGLGKAAISYLLELGKSRNFQTIIVLPDPPAEGFYIRQGAEFTGIEIQSRVKGGPLFREMRFKL